MYCYFLIGIILLFLSYIYHILSIKYNIEYIDRDFLSQFEINMQKMINYYYYTDVDIYNNNKDTTKARTENMGLANTYFPIAKDKDDLDDDDNVRTLYNRDIYDNQTGNLLLSTRGKKRVYPNASEIPPSCGFGKLFYFSRERKWKCVCSAPEYFGGIYCDEPQKELTIKNQCRTVAHTDDMENTDVSTFNPILRGVCVECSVGNATPDLSSPIPRCRTINRIKEDHDDYDDDQDNSNEKSSNCFSDPTNPNLNSIYNVFVEGYGCSCDFYNGFVEATVESGGGERAACIKIGKRDEKNKNYFHKTHLAYYTLKNNIKPIQVHEYQNVEEPYESILENPAKVLVDQPATDIVHKNDWLNRCVKADSRQKIRRLGYPKSDWPVVHKNKWINHYERRRETFPISAYGLAIGRGFETKHWYETTNLRYVSNAVWGHPVVYGSDTMSCVKNEAKYNGNKFIGLTTLNPIGVKMQQYYGLTTLYKPGAIVRMDTRGYDADDDDKTNVLTLPPDLMNEMMDSRDYHYIPMLYNSYTVDK